MLACRFHLLLHLRRRRQHRDRHAGGTRL